MMELLDILDEQNLKELNKRKIEGSNLIHSSSSSVLESSDSENEMFHLEKGELVSNLMNSSKNIDGDGKSTNNEENTNDNKKNNQSSHQKKKLQKSNSWDTIRNEDGSDIFDKKKVLKYSSCDESKRGSQSDIFYKKEVIKYSSYEQRKPKPNIIKPNSPINKISTFESIKIGDFASTNKNEKTVLSRKTDLDIESIESIDESKTNTHQTNTEKVKETIENQEADEKQDPLADEINIENNTNGSEKSRVSSASSGSSSGYSIVQPLGKPNVLHSFNNLINYNRD